MYQDTNQANQDSYANCLVKCLRLTINQVKYWHYSRNYTEDDVIRLESDLKIDDEQTWIQFSFLVRCWVKPWQVHLNRRTSLLFLELDVIDRSRLLDASHLPPPPPLWALAGLGDPQLGLEGPPDEAPDWECCHSISREDQRRLINITS